MSLDMYGFVDTVFDVAPVVVKLLRTSGDYTGAGGAWEQTQTETILPLVNIQPMSLKDVEFLAGGASEPKDMRVIHINDGTMIYPADDSRPSDYLKFTDGIAERTWRVVQSDCRPHRNFCRAIVERFNEHA